MLHYILLIAGCIAKVFFLFVLADFISGIVHWWQDRYGNPKWKIVEPNLIHHLRADAFLKHSYYKRNAHTYILSAVLAGAIYAIPGVQISTALILFAFGSQTVEIHAASHRSKAKNGKFVRFLQRHRIIQTARHHARHHKPPHTGGYCLTTNILNPILDRLRFWQTLELFVFAACKAIPRE